MILFFAALFLLFIYTYIFFLLFFSETLSRDNKRKKIERCEKEKDKDYKRIKHYDESKEKTPDR